MRPIELRYQLVNGDIVPGVVVFVVQAENHVSDAIAAVDGLATYDIPSAIVVREPPGDILRRFRTSSRRYERILGELHRNSLETGRRFTVENLVARRGALVVRNDWGPERHLVEAYKSRGLPTFGWVEGVQDFHDVDTGRSRRPYQTVQTVLTLGDYDAGVLRSQGVADVVPVGSDRLQRLWDSESQAADIDVLINVNFTYGVLTSARSAWTRGALAAAHQNGLHGVVTRHPADRGWTGRLSERRNEAVDAQLRRSARLVSRFSTLIYDALLLGVECYYFNPHRELVSTFHDAPLCTSSSTPELSAQLSQPVRSRSEVRSDARSFLESHVRIGGPPAGTVVARAILDRLA